MVIGWRRLPAIVMIAGTMSSVEAQNTIQIGDSPTCASCAVELQAIVRLGSLDDPAGFGPVVQIAANSKNQYVVSSTTFDGELFLYGEDGKFIRTIGRRGEGPGEFSRTQLLAFDAQDSLHAMDASGPKHSVFAPDLTFVRAVQQQTRTLAMRIEPSGTVFVVAPKMSGEASFALQVLSPDGAALQAFDPIDPNASGQAALGRSITVDPSGRRWSIGTAVYRLKEWSTDAQVTRVFEAKRDWIPETIPMRLERNQQPPAQIAGLEADEAGLLWVFAVLPDANWSPPTPGSRLDPGSMYDTVVEIIDPDTGRLLARSRLDPLVLPFARGRAYSMVEEESGDLRIQVWQMKVIGR